MRLVQNVQPRSGLELEDTSDAIEAVHVLKDSLDSDTVPRIPTKDKSQFRQYDTATARVHNFYKEQHAKQTVKFNLKARERFHSASRVRDKMTVWEALEKLNTLIDKSDPDTELSQIEHLLQTAEAMRRDGQERWMQVVGLVHDLGKLMYFAGTEGQWDVVGDTFPVGCAFSPKNIYPDTFLSNPDSYNPEYNTECGIYEPHCGLDNVMLSWGHDEFLYHIFVNPANECNIPEEGLAMIRYHSFYPWHKEGAYTHLMDKGGKDEKVLKAVKKFNPYDLYSKGEGVPNVESLKPYYQDLLLEFFPKEVLEW